MRPSLFLLLAFLSTVFSRSSISCWTGIQFWEQGLNNVSLVHCLPHQRCCFFTASLNGNNYGCYDACPADGVEQCGPDPKLGIQDLYYCYCKDHNDSKCRPYLGDKK